MYRRAAMLDFKVFKDEKQKALIYYDPCNLYIKSIFSHELAVEFEEQLGCRDRDPQHTG